jgi:hypothetical protein
MTVGGVMSGAGAKVVVDDDVEDVVDDDVDDDVEDVVDDDVDVDADVDVVDGAGEVAVTEDVVEIAEVDVDAEVVDDDGAGAADEVAGPLVEGDGQPDAASAGRAVTTAPVPARTKTSSIDARCFRAIRRMTAPTVRKPMATMIVARSAPVAGRTQLSIPCPRS